MRIYSKVNKKFPFLTRFLQLLLEEIITILGLNRKKSKSIFFNLDLHVGVIADIEHGLKYENAKLIRWSISGHNFLIPNRSSVSDPVQFVNAQNWQELDTSKVSKFRKRYGLFLHSFDGFICTHSPAFAELFYGIKKTLIISSTRYEMPYSSQPDQWSRLNHLLVQGVESQQIHLYANNRGDSDYIKYFTNLDVKVTPSLCEKESGEWIGGQPFGVILSKDKNLITQIEIQTESKFKDIAHLGEPYKWENLLDLNEIFVIPQNISTMSLFEFATAGIPVAIPSRRWILNLKKSGYGILGELTFHELYHLDPPESDLAPTNYKSNKYLDWWLDRADFYDEFLMPNVRIVDSYAELKEGPSKVKLLGKNYWKQIHSRNNHIYQLRKKMIADFING